MKKSLYIFALIIFLGTTGLYAQNTRINNFNTIGWYAYFGTFKLGKKLGLHTEYQHRRLDFVKDKQQNLLRLGINYQLHPKVQARLGYALIETFPYGEIPLNALGKDFTEHRSYQMATITDKVSIVDLSHRFMLEQRWVGRYSNGNLAKEDDFTFFNRLRYMVRFQIPLNRKTVTDKTAYLALYDEVLIGFGKNVNENIFDQNRLAILVGYRFSPVVRIEAGYLNQTLQLGREVNNRNVFQRNNGFILNANFNVDLSKN